MTCLCFSRMSNKARQWTSMWHVWRRLEDIISTVEIPQWCWQLNPARERWYIQYTAVRTISFLQLYCNVLCIIVSKISMKCRTRNMSTKHCTRGKYAKCCIGLQYFITDCLYYNHAVQFKQSCPQAANHHLARQSPPRQSCNFDATTAPKPLSIACSPISMPCRCTSAQLAW